MSSVVHQSGRARRKSIALLGIASLLAAAGTADAAAIASARDTRTRSAAAFHAQQPVATSGVLDAVDSATGTMVVNGTRYAFDERLFAWRETRGGTRVRLKLEELRPGTTIHFRNVVVASGMPRIVEIVLP